ncbi:hypothetical protein ACFO4E_08650 [Nocardiopsis mangrovi]|uniref:Uncharacterized protein n=1 Tax=Nocardiopsis mangrovi TaxID=1179818 RepID=A0ABV9DT72_9ACTN
MDEVSTERFAVLKKICAIAAISVAAVLGMAFPAAAEAPVSDGGWSWQ